MAQAQTCSNHPDRKALSLCHHCKRYYCSECLKEGSEFYYCKRPECLRVMDEEFIPAASPAEPPQTGPSLPEDLALLALYPNASEATQVRTRLEAEGLECFSVEAASGVIEGPYLAPLQLMVKVTDWDKALLLLDKVVAEGLPEPLVLAMDYIEMRDAEEAKEKLDTARIPHFLWDRLSSSQYQVHESFGVLTRASDYDKATGLLIVPESE